MACGLCSFLLRQNARGQLFRMSHFFIFCFFYIKNIISFFLSRLLPPNTEGSAEPCEAIGASLRTQVRIFFVGFIHTYYLFLRVCSLLPLPSTWRLTPSPTSGDGLRSLFCSSSPKSYSIPHRNVIHHCRFIKTFLHFCSYLPLPISGGGFFCVRHFRILCFCYTYFFVSVHKKISVFF